ncbi:MAG: hypothetical protein II857_11215 [Selenomonadaceae bacterium]|nr:hypothetical protein [Selenomonadaceae bacterium]
MPKDFTKPQLSTEIATLSSNEFALPTAGLVRKLDEATVAPEEIQAPGELCRQRFFVVASASLPLNCAKNCLAEVFADYPLISIKVTRIVNRRFLQRDCPYHC